MRSKKEWCARKSAGMEGFLTVVCVVLLNEVGDEWCSSIMCARGWERVVGFEKVVGFQKWYMVVQKW
jgi:hypothetical protein